MFHPVRFLATNHANRLIYLWFHLGLHLASVIIPIFIHFLPDSTSSNVQNNEQLMLYITERLQHLSSAHPKEFSSAVQRLKNNWMNLCDWSINRKERVYLILKNKARVLITALILLSTVRMLCRENVDRLIIWLREGVFFLLVCQ